MRIDSRVVGTAAALLAGRPAMRNFSAADYESFSSECSERRQGGHFRASAESKRIELAEKLGYEKRDANDSIAPQLVGTRAAAVAAARD